VVNEQPEQRLEPGVTTPDGGFQAQMRLPVTALISNM
jgi:hypothetical protein